MAGARFTVSDCHRGRLLPGVRSRPGGRGHVPRGRHRSDSRGRGFSQSGERGADPQRRPVRPRAVLEELAQVIPPAALESSSRPSPVTGCPRLNPEEDAALATTPVEELLSLAMLQPGRFSDELHAYQVSKRANVLRVQAEAVRWGERGARVSAIKSRHHHHPAGPRRAVRGQPCRTAAQRSTRSRTTHREDLPHLITGSEPCQPDERALGRPASDRSAVSSSG